MKAYAEWGTFRKIVTNVAFWLPVQLAIILLLESLGLVPSNLSMTKSGFNGPCGGLAYWAYTSGCCRAGLTYTIAGSVLVSVTGLGGRRFWYWFAGLYSVYLAATLISMMYYEGAWFHEGFGCYVMDVWISPLYWLGELYIAKYLYTRRHNPAKIKHP